MASKRNLLPAAIVLVLLSLAVLMRQHHPAESTAAPKPTAAALPPGRMAPAPIPIAPGDFTANAWRERLADYERAAVYPWWSRPHDDGSRPLLAWNQPAVSDLPFADDPNAPTSYHFAADKMHVPYGESMTSWIEVWKTGETRERVPAHVKQAWVMAVDGAPGRMLPLGYADDGSHRYTNTFVPSEHKELALSRQVRIVAEVEAGGQTRTMLRDFTYAPREVLRVVGISDSIADGSLTISLDVDVLEAGTYTFQANLMAADGTTPLAWNDIGAQLASGRQRVRLVFFGKILRDQLQNGPYVMRDLRGFLHKDDAEHNLWWSYPNSYRTAAYAAADFSPAEWDSAEKREKVAGMHDIIDKTARGELGGGSGASPHIHIGEDGIARQVSP